MPAHEDIRVRFEVGGREFEAVGFLREGEYSVLGDEMLARTATKNGGAVGDEDDAFLSKHHAEFPQKLWRYCLVTKRRDPAGPRRVSCFGWLCGGWCQGWGCLGHRWDEHNLVVRRCT